MVQKCSIKYLQMKCISTFRETLFMLKWDLFNVRKLQHITINNIKHKNHIIIPADKNQKNATSFMTESQITEYKKKVFQYNKINI